MKLLEYYNESKTRKLGRIKIMDQCCEYFSTTPVEVVTMKELAEYLKIERRTLYHYYKSKSDLLVDIFLYTNERLLEWHNASHKDLLDKLKKYPVKEKLKRYFKHYVKEFDQESKTIKLSVHIDTLIKSLDKNSDTYKRYITISNSLREDNNVALNIIKEGIENGEIENHGCEAEDLLAILDQSFRAYYFKTISRKQHTKQYKLKYIDKFIEIMIAGIF